MTRVQLMKMWSVSWQSLLYNPGEMLDVLRPGSVNVAHNISVFVFNITFLVVVTHLIQ